MRKPNKLPSTSYLRSVFIYDQETGLLTWKQRPLEHFTSVNGFHAFNGLYAGKIAGNMQGNGYLRVVIDGTSYLVHRVIYKMQKGREPKGEVDHRDTNRANNRWKNLRIATSSQNQHNAKIRKDNKTGFKGVQRVGNKYLAAVILHSEKAFHEYFDTPEEAYEARCKASKKLHKKFVRNETRINSDEKISTDILNTLATLTNQEKAILRNIAKFTQTPKSTRFGYKKNWSPKTNEKLHEKGLIEYKFNSVILTEEGHRYL
jgi:hypothetical protein